MKDFLVEKINIPLSALYGLVDRQDSGDSSPLSDDERHALMFLRCAEKHPMWDMPKQTLELYAFTNGLEYRIDGVRCGVRDSDWQTKQKRVER